MIQGIYHIGIHADDPAQLALFYRDVLDMQIIGGSPADDPFGVSAFLSNEPDRESHHLAIFQQKQFAHTAFKVASLADLRDYYRRVAARGLPIKMALNHGVSLAFYFDDPAGNMVEVYWPTGRACHQPHGDPIDLSLSEEELLRDVERFPLPVEGVLSIPEPWRPAGPA
jgi:catechol-2,3-dioxygenase